jgi:hypothetical protein
MSAIKRMLEDIIEAVLDNQRIHGMSTESALFEVAKTRGIEPDAIHQWMSEILPYIPED